ncbi:hydroxymethylbilane synthase [Lipingzhangella sp. LS1_29]|uniref:Porphobilinogen deaminase n=1 Tax=Lipingzhangella rawalii TaxID=2055835 RepID=A0ABU2H9B9_9ACTN|nr:hydroxymethylbilane synthase [Lipingzhangella rawalii]MDS1271902.1 hydroxymethylbilane synthase [Lipingzhangella rawalii]
MADTSESAPSTIRLGTRRSTMATTQSGELAEVLRARTGVAVELVPITSYGDVTQAQLTQLGGTGVFVSALRNELLAGTVDIAVHSLKDLPTAAPADIELAAVSQRDDHRDALCARDGLRLAQLPAGARVGTGSPRRVAQLAALRPDLEYVPIRGNAETRLGKVASGEVDAVVLAHAGLRRVGRLGDVTEVLEAEAMLPAPGQGALAVECRAADAAPGGRLAFLAAIDDPVTRAEVTAERSVLAELEAGCAAPVGALARTRDGQVWLRAVAAATDGSAAVRGESVLEVENAANGGRELARTLITKGADRLVANARDLGTVSER